MGYTSRFFLIGFNDFIKLLGHLEVTLGPILVEIMEDKGRRVKNGPQKWHVDVARTLHIISLCIRPKGFHKQEIHIFPTYFACPRRARRCQPNEQWSGPGHFGVASVPLSGNFGHVDVNLG